MLRSSSDSTLKTSAEVKGQTIRRSRTNRPHKSDPGVGPNWPPGVKQEEETNVKGKLQAGEVDDDHYYCYLFSVMVSTY